MYSLAIVKMHWIWSVVGRAEGGLAHLIPWTGAAWARVKGGIGHRSARIHRLFRVGLLGRPYRPRPVPQMGRPRHREGHVQPETLITPPLLAESSGVSSSQHPARSPHVL